LIVSGGQLLNNIVGNEALAVSNDGIYVFPVFEKLKQATFCSKMIKSCTKSFVLNDIIK